MSYIRAPFTDDQVQKLNENQVGLGGPVLRAFTCRNSADHRHGVEGGAPGILIATKYGWVCPHCNYKRDWAFAIMATRLTRPPTAIQSFVNTTPSIEKANILLGQYERLAATERPGAAVMVACIKSRIEEMSLPGFGTIELSEIPTDAVVRRSEGRNYRIVSGQSHLQAALRLTGRALVTDAVTHEQLHVRDIDEGDALQLSISVFRWRRVKPEALPHWAVGLRCHGLASRAAVIGAALLLSIESSRHRCAAGTQLESTLDNEA